MSRYWTDRTPGAGDLGAPEVLVASLHRAGERLTRAADELAPAATGLRGTWSGQSVDAWVARAEDGSRHLRTLAEPAGAAAAALGDYVQTVRGIAARSAQAAAALSEHTAALRTALAGVEALTPADEPWRKVRAEGRVDEARTGIAGATGQLAWLAEERRSADAYLVHRLAALVPAGWAQARPFLATLPASVLARTPGWEQDLRRWVVTLPGGIEGLLDPAGPGGWLDARSDAAKRLLDGAVDSGLLPASDPRYKRFLLEYWQRKALERAGISLADWDPAQGTAANASNITKVYEYYGQLFLDHPWMQWAGMANLIGPSFAGGFYDLQMLRDLGRKAREAGGDVPDLPGTADDVTRRMLDVLAGMSDSELRYFETTFLSMQQKIFLDQAPMHEAFLAGGTAEIDRMAAAGIVGPSTKEAWHKISDGLAHGSTDLIGSGNKALLHREQWDIIKPDYDRMRAHPVTGEAFTWAMTLVGSPSIPGARGYPDVIPLVVDLGETPRRFGPLPLPSVDLGEVVTPLPDGNISVDVQRWELIERDTLPAYQDLVRNHPDELRAIVGSDFSERLERQRLVHRVDDIAEHLLTDWEYRR